MRVFAPSMAMVARRAVAALPRRRRTRAPGLALSFSGAAAPLAKMRPPLRPLPRAIAGSAKSSLISPFASTFQSNKTIAVSRSTSGLIASSTMIGPNSPRPCWPASVKPAWGKYRLKPGSGATRRMSALAPDFSRSWVRPPTPALAFAARKPGKLSVVGSASLFTEFELQRLALPELEERAGDRPGIGVDPCWLGRGRDELKSRRRGLEAHKAVSRRGGRVRPRACRKGATPPP